MGWWEVVALGGGSLAVWLAHWSVLLVQERGRRRTVVAILLRMDRAEQQLWLAEDIWPRRCRCGRWGVPSSGWVVLDDEARHEAQRCQPIREAIP